MAIEASWKTWRKSRRSGEAGCVEARVVERVVEVRDSKQRHGPTLRFTFAEWEAFLAGVNDGDFDLPSNYRAPRQSA